MAGDAVVASPVEVTVTPWERMKGLLGRPSLPPGRAMWFDRCSLLHTCGMRFAIDVLFLDRDRRVVRLCPAVPPFRLVWGGPRARIAIEAAPGTFPAAAVMSGVQLRLGAP